MKRLAILTVAVLVAGMAHAAYTTTNFVDAAALQSDELYHDGLNAIAMKNAAYDGGGLRYGLLRTDISGITSSVLSSKLDYAVKQQAGDVPYTIYFWGVVESAPAQDWDGATVVIDDVAPTDGTGMFTATEDLHLASDPNLVLLGTNTVPGSGNDTQPNVNQTISGQALNDWLNADTDGDGTIVLSVGENLNTLFRSVSNNAAPSLSYSYIDEGIVYAYYQIGGLLGDRDKSWKDTATTSGTTNATYTFADPTDPALVFTVSATAANGDTMKLNTNMLTVDSSGRQTDSSTGRLSDDEAVTITVSYVDPNNSLGILSMDGVGTYWGNGASEVTRLTDAEGNVSDALTAFSNDTSVFGNWGDLVVGLQNLSVDNTDTWSLTFTAANTNTQSGAGGFRIKYWLGEASDIDFYGDWLALYPGLGTQTNYTDDVEPDGMNNLMEYALGGDPLVNDAATIMPAHNVDGGYLNYVYTRRTDADIRLLEYNVFSSLDLVFGPITNETDEVGSVAIDADFESVTNRVSITAEGAQFMQLKVQQN